MTLCVCKSLCVWWFESYAGACVCAFKLTLALDLQHEIVRNNPHAIIYSLDPTSEHCLHISRMM